MTTAEEKLLDMGYAAQKSRYFALHYKRRDGTLGSAFIDYHDQKWSLRKVKEISADPLFLEWISPEYVTGCLSEFYGCE